LIYSLDPIYWLFVGPPILLALWAQWRVKSTFSRYSRVGNARGLTGAEAAAVMLRHAGIDNVDIRRTGGYLSDHYNPVNRSLALSPDVHDGRSISAIGVACHEAGHAIQHATRYRLLGLRSRVVPFAKIGGWLAWPMIILGLILQMKGLAMIGVIAFGALVLFQLVTLPVEFDASRRAKEQLRDLGLTVNAEEDRGVAKVLGAAAMTYVAATIQAVAQLLYFLYILGFFGRRGSA